MLRHPIASALASTALSNQAKTLAAAVFTLLPEEPGAANEKIVTALLCGRWR